MECVGGPVLAAGGAVVSGTCRATLGSPERPRRIPDASVEADYVATPRRIEGREDADFIRPS